MRNEILEELWQSKDAVAKEYGYDIDKLVRGLREKEESDKARVIDLRVVSESNLAVVKGKMVSVDKIS